MEKNIWSLYFLHIPLVISSWYQVLSIVQMLISHLYLQVSSCLLNNKKLISICPFSLWTPRKYLNLVRLRFSSINSWLFLKVKVKIFRKANKLSVTLLVLLIMPRILLMSPDYFTSVLIAVSQTFRVLPLRVLTHVQSTRKTFLPNIHKPSSPISLNSLLMFHF
jgi:hypothetical protein